MDNPHAGFNYKIDKINTDFKLSTSRTSGHRIVSLYFATRDDYVMN